MSSGEANRLAPCHTRITVRGHGKTFLSYQRARGSKVPQLKCS